MPPSTVSGEGPDHIPAGEHTHWVLVVIQDKEALGARLMQLPRSCGHGEIARTGVGLSGHHVSHSAAQNLTSYRQIASKCSETQINNLLKATKGAFIMERRKLKELVPKALQQWWI